MKQHKQPTRAPVAVAPATLAKVGGGIPTEPQPWLVSDPQPWLNTPQPWLVSEGQPWITTGQPWLNKPTP